MKKKKNPALAKTIIKWFWIAFVSGIALLSFVFLLISQGVIGYVPPVEELENPIDKYASQVISVDQQLLGTYAQSKENRIYSSYEDLSPGLINALIATEDARFIDHSGIDAYAILRAIVKSGIFMQSSAGGGSTITQQLAKQLYSPKADNIIERVLQKPIEWVIAVNLEKFYTKEEIINLYLNKFDFLNNAVGIQSASWVYFSKKPKELSVEEAATLIGMCKNPSLYNPRRRLQACQERRNVVLSQMQKYDYLTEAERDSLKKIPLQLKYNKVDHKDGSAPYFREYLRLIMTAPKPDKSDYAASWQQQKYTEDSLAWETNPLYGWCNKNEKSGGEHYNLYTDGLKIFTTVDSRMQQYAEQAVVEHIGNTLQPLFFKEKAGRKNGPFSNSVKQGDIDKILERTMKQSDRYRGMKRAGYKDQEIRDAFSKPVEMTVFSWSGMRDTIMSPMDSLVYMKSFLRSGFMAMDPRSGHVKAYVGGTDFRAFQYDMINMGRRQVGSTVKPYLYALAMENDFTPCDEMLHVEQEYLDENGRPWRPRNANKKRIGEMVSIKWGLQNSDNWVTAYLMSKLSPYTFARTLHAFGLKGTIDPVISLALGACDASVSEMVTGYSAFANRGVKVNPLYVTRIEDGFGNVLASFTPEIAEVMSEKAAAKMLDMLQAVMDGGTGSRVRYMYGVTAPMGGKTGTTQNNSDGWFMGFSPSLVGGVWVGGEDRSIHFDRMAEGQAASMALPVFALFMKKVYANKDLGYSETEQFEVSPQYRDVCANSSDSIDSGEPAGIDDLFQ